MTSLLKENEKGDDNLEYNIMKIKNTADTSREKILTELTWEEHSMTQQRNTGTFVYFHYDTAETIQDDKGK